MCNECYNMYGSHAPWCTVGYPPTAASATELAASRCRECNHHQGFHGSACSQFPKRGNKNCTDCGWFNGKHKNSCTTKGYLVGSTPRRDTPVMVRTPKVCPCGIDSRDCDYHR